MLRVYMDRERERRMRRGNRGKTIFQARERPASPRNFEGSYPAMWQTTGQSGYACDPDCQKGMHATRWQRATTVDV